MTACFHHFPTFFLLKQAQYLQYSFRPTAINKWNIYNEL
uniref:Uncharacterized protein n=1 Tax=Anguilla anguilla TaxID=7936 RepID=A0A0E9R4D7_ANGAN